MTERCGSCSPIFILGRLCRLRLAWDGRSRHVPTLDRRHMRGQGAQGRPAARFVRDGVCPHCRVNFHCRTRAMAHLEKGAREALMNGLLPELTEEELREADQDSVSQTGAL